MAPIFRAIYASFKPTRDWYNAVVQICALGQQQIAQGIEQAGELSRHITEINHQISAEIDASYWKSCASEDQVYKAMDQSIRGVDSYCGADGKVEEVPLGFDHYYKNQQGDVVATSDPNFDPNQGGFVEMSHVDQLAAHGQ